MELKLESITALNDTAFIIFIIGIMFFIFAVLSMVFLFGWSMKDAQKNWKGLAIFLAISLSIPYGVVKFQNNMPFLQASTPILLQNLNVVNDGDYIVVQFSTSEPARVYLEIIEPSTDEMTPFLPTSTFEKKLQHSFILPNDVQGAQMYFIINGDKYQAVDKPFLIK